MLPNDSIREGIFQATPVFLRNQGKYIVAYTTQYDSHSSIHCMYFTSQWVDIVSKVYSSFH
jgi:hypothetical protein